MTVVVPVYRTSERADVLPSVIEGVNSIAEAAHEAADFATVLRRVAQVFAASTGVSRCSLRLPDPSSSGYRLALSLGKSDYTAQGQRMLDGSDPFSAEVLARRAPVVVEDTRGDPRMSPIARASTALGVYSMIGVPIMFGEKTVALAFLDNEFEQVTYSQWQIEAARQLGALCGSALVSASVLIERKDALQCARKENEALRRLARLESLLEGVTSEGLAPPLCARNAARLLGRPVSLYNWAWRTVGTAGVKGVPLDLGSKAVRSHPKIAAELEHVRRGQTRIVGPLPAIGVHSKSIIAPVGLGAENWGVLVVHEAGKTFQPFETEVSARVATRYGGSLAIAGHGATTVAALRSAVAQDIVGGDTDDAGLEGRAQAAGFDPDTARILVLFEPLSAELRPAAVECLTDSMSTVLGPVVAVPCVNRAGLAVLATAPSASRDLAAALSDILESQPMLADVSAVISGPFTALGATMEANAECQQAMRCVHRFRHLKFPRVARVSDFGPALPFMASADVHEVRAFARKQIQGLDGAAGEDDLLVTLQVFVESFNVRRCARALSVHENTVRYRLARIEKLTGLDLLNDPGGQLRAELTVSAMRLVGDLPWTSPCAG
ncbi:hypothetical protein BVC93_21820 [Mycobacterium sp. MS1601]|uniref:GAF domain-containing protein n=1 Tax=Mycobacterium sp. MS1601 TaxID=1936029 RepID=UPI0009795E0A|nr:GAF domain-containing protein [Mycobacterium sp. MS1601]AQA04620.1 hypothetical protein BVC93_21820 [Mycobacterium sp. MS1601]